jgi:hypothetical protein
MGAINSEERLAICKACEEFTLKLVCAVCKCVMPIKVKIESAECPKGKW